MSECSWQSRVSSGLKSPERLAAMSGLGKKRRFVGVQVLAVNIFGLSEKPW